MDVILYRKEDKDGRLTVSLERLDDGSVQVFFYDIGDYCMKVWGDSDYEHWVKVPPAELPKLAFALLAEKYRGRSDAVEDFGAFCAAHGIEHENMTWT